MKLTDLRKRISLSSPKTLIIIVGVILFTCLFGMLLIRDVVTDADITAKITKIGFVITGVKEDANYSQTHYDALMNIKDELNLEIICKENTPEDTACFDAMKELIEKDGCEVIIAPSFGYGKYVKELAVLFPDICFLQPMGTESLPNMATCIGRMYQARYLSGIVAGMHTETGEIGYAAAFPIPELIRQINAFTLGVRSVSPEAAVHVIYINSWVDNDAAENASEELLDKYPDIDILTMHTNSLMPDRVAAERGIWSIGINKDNSALFPDSYLTACVWTWDDYYRQMILSWLQGKFYGRHGWIDMEDGMVALLV